MRKTIVLVACCLAPSACATQRVGPDPMAAVGPPLTVERFLQAANAMDLDAMSRLFGTADGPFGDTGNAFGCAFKKMGSWIGIGERCQTRQEVELQMHAIASILQHQDYRITSEAAVPGRVHRTTRIGVDVTQGGNVIRDVGFLVVRSGDGQWMVQEIEVDKITGG